MVTKLLKICTYIIITGCEDGPTISQNKDVNTFMLENLKKLHTKCLEIYFGILQEISITRFLA